MIEPPSSVGNWGIRDNVVPSEVKTTEGFLNVKVRLILDSGHATYHIKRSFHCFGIFYQFLSCRKIRM